MDLFELRQEYANQQHDLESTSSDPFEQFQSWFKDASNAKLLEPNAMVLGTTNGVGMPALRIVLLKSLTPEGFTFFSNYNSRKAKHLESNNQATLLFPWHEMQRQVEVQGTIEKTSREESESYFSKRPRGSQLGAWVSDQSSEISSRQELEDSWQEFEAKFGDQPVPTPEHWGGYRLKPNRFEFWQGGSKRLHDRVIYEMQQGSWTRSLLAP